MKSLWLRRLLLFVLLASSMSTSAQTNEVTFRLRHVLGRGQIHDVDFSPNEEIMVVATATGVYAHELDNLGANPIHLIADVYAQKLAFSADGERIALITLENSVEIYETSGVLVAWGQLPQSDTLVDITFGVSGSHVLLTTATARVIRYDYTLDALSLIDSAVVTGSSHALVSASGTAMLSWANTETRSSFQLWQLEPAVVRIAKWDSPVGKVFVHYAISGDGSTIVAREESGAVYVTRLENRYLMLMEDMVAPFGSKLVLSFDGSKLVAAPITGNFIEWSLTNNSILDQGSKLGRDFVYSPSGHLAAMWHIYLGGLAVRLTTETALAVIDEYSGGLTGHDVDTVGNRLLLAEATTNGYKLGLWDLDSGLQISSCSTCDYDDLSALRFWPGSRLIFVGNPGRVEALSANFQVVARAEFEGLRPYTPLNGGRVVGTRSSGRTDPVNLEVYDLESKALLGAVTLDWRLGQRTASADGTWLAVWGGMNYPVEIRDVCSLARSNVIGTTGSPLIVRFSPDRSLIAVGSEISDRTESFVTIYETNDWTAVALLSLPQGLVGGWFAFSNDSSLLALSAPDGIQVYSSPSWRQVGLMPQKNYGSLWLHLSDSFLAVVHGEGYVEVYDVLRR